jgi:hypothetical protein
LKGTLFDPIKNQFITSVPYDFDGGFHSSVNITYKPVMYEYGDSYASFTWNCLDIEGLNMTSDVTETISVTQVNHPPVILNYTVSTKENVDVLFKLHAIDYDKDQMQFSIKSLPKNGYLHRLDSVGSKGVKIMDSITMNLNEDQLYYSPNLNYYGIDDFTLIAQDNSNSKSDIGKIVFNVSFVNQPPYMDS